MIAFSCISPEGGENLRLQVNMKIQLDVFDVPNKYIGCRSVILKSKDRGNWPLLLFQRNLV